MEPRRHFSRCAFTRAMYDDVRHLVGCGADGAARSEHEEGAYVGKGLPFGDDTTTHDRSRWGYGVTHLVPGVVHRYPDGLFIVRAQEGGHAVQRVDGGMKDVHCARLGASVIGDGNRPLRYLAPDEARVVVGERCVVRLQPDAIDVDELEPVGNDRTRGDVVRGGIRAPEEIGVDRLSILCEFEVIVSSAGLLSNAEAHCNGLDLTGAVGGQADAESVGEFAHDNGRVHRHSTGRPSRGVTHDGKSGDDYHGEGSEQDTPALNSSHDHARTRLPMVELCRLYDTQYNDAEGGRVAFAAMRRMMGGYDAPGIPCTCM